MSGIYSWVKSLIVGFCFLELLGHLIVNAQYQRYLRFFGGVVMLLLILSPAADIFSAGDLFNEALHRALLEEETMELADSQELLADLKNSRISEAYQKELERQIEEVVEAYGQTAAVVELEFPEEISAGTAVTPDGVKIVLEEKATEEAAERENAVSSIRAELSSVYGIPKNSIRIQTG